MSGSPSARDKALKREWLKTRGALREDSEASSSRQVLDSQGDSRKLTAQDVQEILGNISDDAWVLKACLAEVDQAADGELDDEQEAQSGLVALLKEGIRRSATSKSKTTSQIHAVLDSLEKRLTAIADVSSKQPDTQEVEDGWDLDEDPSSTTPSDQGPPLSLLLQPSLEDVVASLIVQSHYKHVQALLKAGDFASALALSRFDLVELLLTSAERTALEIAFGLRLVPVVDDKGKESSVWIDEVSGAALLSQDDLFQWFESILREWMRRGGSHLAIVEVITELEKHSSEVAAKEAFRGLGDLRAEAELGQLISSSGGSKTASANLAVGSHNILEVAHERIRQELASKPASQVFSSSALPLLRHAYRRRPSSANTAANEREFLASETRQIIQDLVSLPNKDPSNAFKNACSLLSTSDVQNILGRDESMILAVSLAYSLGESDPVELGALAQVMESVGDERVMSEFGSDPSTLALGLNARISSKSSPNEVEPVTIEATRNLFANGSREGGKASDQIASSFDEAKVCAEIALELSQWKSFAPVIWYAASFDADQKRDQIRRVITRAQGKRPEEYGHLLSLLMDVEKGRAWYPLTHEEIYSIALQALLESGQLPLFKTVTSSNRIGGKSLPTLSEGQVTDIALRASHALYERASSSNHHKGELKIAHDITTSLPKGPLLKQEQEFIEATSRLGSYKLNSRVHAGVPLLPEEIRRTKDRMTLIAALLSSQDDAFRAWESILDLAVRLNAGARPQDEKDSQELTPKAMVEVRTLAMLCEAAIAAEDFKRASKLGSKLIDSINALRKRAAAAARAARQNRQDEENDETHVTSSARTREATECLPEAEELGWKTCYQLAKHPGWEDYHLRMQFMGHVLALCPNDRIPSMTRKWNQLYEQATQDAVGAQVDADNLFFAKRRPSVKSSSLSNAAAGLGSLVDAYASPFASLLAHAGTRSSASRRDITGIPPTPNTADSFGASQASAAMAASPTGGAAAAARGGAFGSRAAQLFDALGGGGGAASGSSDGGFDPAERAARVARNFFGTLAGAPSGSPSAARQAQNQTASGSPSAGQNATSYGGGTFSFSKGVGWLLGEDEKR